MAENGLQKLIKGIFSHIKDKYGYTDEQALIYLQGCQDCAEEHQQSLEKRDKMLRDTVAELFEAKRLLKSAANVLNMFIPCDEDYNCSECIKQRQNCDYDDSFKWRYADEALALLGKDIDVPASADDTNVGRKSGGWISFENTPPRTSGVFNVIYKSNERKIVTSCYYDGIDTWYHDICINHDRIVTDKVIMWQPLPEPPKED